MRNESLTETSSPDPHPEYSKRLQQRRAAAARQARLSQTIANLRLLVFTVTAAVVWFAMRPGLLSAGWLMLPVAGFTVLILFHDRTERLRRMAERSAAFYERGLARLEDRWVGKGAQGTEFLNGEHPYALDLDLFGRGSLFELLCTARTKGGEQTLAAWLQAPAEPEEISARHTAVKELQPKLDLREQLALLGEDVRSRLDPAALASWGSAPLLLGSPPLRVTAFALAMLTVVTLIGWAALGFGPLPFFVMLGLEGVFAFRLRARVLQVIASVARAGRDLTLLSEILACLEQEQFTTPRLAALRAALDTNGTPPSRQISRLGRLINLLESRQNQIFVPFAALLLWTTQLALALEAWRAVSGPTIPRWLAAVAEFEALSALAGYAYEHPADPFPAITTGGPCFEGEGLGHPLIPESRCVRNDVALGHPLRVLIVSGSNMSGKSTLLRTVGTNTVLALAGAPVRARRLQLSPLAVGATLRIQDSLQAGSSRFYAEITRVRQLMNIANGPLPLLFLLDEIFHGTNSHDRQIGAEAVVRGLVERNAIGLVTTHDLALVHIAESLAPRAANVCFEDHLEDGTLVFDYRMRPGIVKKSNALALMRSVGLEV